MLTFATSTQFDGPLSADDVDAVAAFRAVLQRHGFAGADVLSALGGALPLGKFHLREDLPLYLRRLAPRTPINTLIKLFVLDQVVEEDALRAAIDPVRPTDLQRMGLILSEAGGVRARVRLSGYDGLVLAHDGYDERNPLTPDHVLEVNPTSVTLAALTVRRRARSALDVGTGCGVLALLAARHSDRVVGTDTNARALNFASFNARLNGFEHLEFRQGSLFEPVARERFDLIVCNPPYVISPDSRYIFRDGGRRGDALSEEVVRRIPEYLEEDGFASVLCNWTLQANEEPAAPPLRWVASSGCDAWILWTKTQDPLTYSALWNRSRDGAAYREALDRWTSYFADLGADAIGLGAVILRKRAGAANWARANQIPEGPVDSAGRQIERVFGAQDRLSALDDAALLAVRFAAADDHRLRHSMAFRDGEYRIDSAEVCFDGGLRFSGTVDDYTIHLLARCDGRRTLGEVAGELAQKGGKAPGDVARVCALIARRLASLGFLIPTT